MISSCSDNMNIPRLGWELVGWGVFDVLQILFRVRVATAVSLSGMMRILKIIINEP